MRDVVRSSTTTTIRIKIPNRCVCGFRIHTSSNTVRLCVYRSWVVFCIIRRPSDMHKRTTTCRPGSIDASRQPNPYVHGGGGFTSKLSRARRQVRRTIFDHHGVPHDKRNSTKTVPFIMISFAPFRRSRYLPFGRSSIERCACIIALSECMIVPVRTSSC